MQCSSDEICEIFRITRRTLTTWKNEGCPVERPGSRGKAAVFDPSDVLDWWAIRKTGRSTKPESLERERARLTKEQADAKERDNALAKREIVRIDIIEEPIRRWAKQTADMFAALPMKLKNRIPTLTSVELDFVRDEIANFQNAIIDSVDSLDVSTGGDAEDGAEAGVGAAKG